MNSDLAVPINWMLAVALASVVAVLIGIWSHPSALRRIAARYLARADALDQSRSVFDRSLERWNKRLGIPPDRQRAAATSAQERIA
jgi:hypothetical protein